MSKPPADQKDKPPKKPARAVKDILACPDASLHSTAAVAAFLGKSASGVRLLVKNDVLQPFSRTTTGIYFTTAEIKRYFKDAALFKDGKGIPLLQKGPTPDEPTDTDV